MKQSREGIERQEERWHRDENTKVIVSRTKKMGRRRRVKTKEKNEQ